jgi:hypothetical protein
MTKIESLKNFIKSSPIIMLVVITSSTVVLHWSLVQLYATYCAPWGIFGAFQTFLTLGSPMCQFANTVQYELGKHYITIWIGAAAACFTWLVGNFKS